MGRKKLLLLGATGMAGHMIYYYLNTIQKYDIINTVYRKKLTDNSFVLDITNKEATEKLIKKLNPDIILNCIGVLINSSRIHLDNAVYVNAYLPHLLERISAEINARLIHISTDCVFSGRKGNYLESDIRDADDIYGKSKGLGEVINCKDITIRTSIIGPELKRDGEGLFHWFMNQKGEINGYTQTFWGGVTTLELAKAIEVAIEDCVTGLVHLTNGHRISKYDLLLLIKEAWGKSEVTIQPVVGKKMDKSLMKSDRLKHIVPSYSEMLSELYNWMQVNKDLYQEFYKYSRES